MVVPTAVVGTAATVVEVVGLAVVAPEDVVGATVVGPTVVVVALGVVLLVRVVGATVVLEVVAFCDVLLEVVGGTLQ